MQIPRRALLAIPLIALLTVAAVSAAVANDPPPRIAFLANGINPADALAAGPIAGQLGAPIFTTAPDALVESTDTALTAYDPELVIVMGGPAAISDAVLTQVADATGLDVVVPTPPPTSGIVRAAGDDRFQTAAAAAALLGTYDPAYLPTDTKAADSDKLDGKDSTDFLATDGKAQMAGHADTAEDADTLDGLDASAFQPVGDYATVPATRTISVGPGDMLYDPADFSASGGSLIWDRANISMGTSVMPPADWDGNDVEMTIWFRTPPDAGDVDFFARVDSYSPGNVVSDATGLNGPPVPASEVDIVQSQTITIPASRLQGNAFWRVRLQRDLNGGDTYPTGVLLHLVTLTYGTS